MLHRLKYVFLPKCLICEWQNEYGRFYLSAVLFSSESFKNRGTKLRTPEVLEVWNICYSNLWSWIKFSSFYLFFFPGTYNCQYFNIQDESFFTPISAHYCSKWSFLSTHLEKIAASPLENGDSLFSLSNDTSTPPGFLCFSPRTDSIEGSWNPG